MGNDEQFMRPNNGNTIYYVNKYVLLEKDYLAAVGTYFDRKGVNYEVEIDICQHQLKTYTKGYKPI